MNDPRAESWVQHLRAELAFPQPAFGGAEAPRSAREALDRLLAAEAELRDGVTRAGGVTDPEPEEPAWFLALADRFLPLASWYGGVGLADSPELPDWLRELLTRVKRVPGASRALDLLHDRIARLSQHNAGVQAAFFALLKLHLEGVLRPLGAAEVTFGFPEPGARVAELSPPPAPGSATAGTVARVLCPAVTVRLQGGAAGERTLARGAHVRAR